MLEELKVNTAGFGSNPELKGTKGCGDGACFFCAGEQLAALPSGARTIFTGVMGLLLKCGGSEEIMSC